MSEIRVPNSNRLAKLMHPARQAMVISEVTPVSQSMNTYVMKAADGHELAYFEAGAYMPVFVDVDGNEIERPYSLSSSPKQAEDGLYTITVKKADGGYISNYIHEHWKAGDHVTLGAPQNGESYNSMRDGSNIIALAGGSGVTHFLSMAQALVDGDVDCKTLTLFYGVNTWAEVMCPEKWKELEAQSNGRFRLVTVVEDGTGEADERGFITMDMVKKYCGSLEDTSFYVSGPPAMNRAMLSALAKEGISRKFIRQYMGGDSPFNSQEPAKETYSLTVHCAGEVKTIPAKANQTILSALEQGGYHPAVRCRSGRCGFCRAYVVKGDYSYADIETGVRYADKALGFIHPCCAYPASDIELVIQRQV